LKPIATIVLLLLLNRQTIFAKEFYKDSTHNRCRTILDTLTQTNVYVSADVLPKNEGDAEYFEKRLQHIVLDSIPNGCDGHFIVAFIVDTSGKVYGGRILKAPVFTIGLFIVTLVKSLHWTPALCNGKKVNMLYVKDFNIDSAEK